MNGMRPGRVHGKKEAAACLGGGFLLKRAVASECEGALAEAVHGVCLLAVGEQGLAGEGYVFGDVSQSDVKELADLQHVGELCGGQYEVVAVERPPLAAWDDFLPILLGGGCFLDGISLRLDVITLDASAGHRGAVL